MLRMPGERKTTLMHAHVPPTSVFTVPAGLARVSHQMSQQRRSITLLRKSVMSGQAQGLSRASMLQNVIEELEDAAHSAAPSDPAAQVPACPPSGSSGRAALIV